MSESIVVLRATASTNGYGDPVLDWAAPTSTSVRARGVEPRPSSEPTPNARNSVITGWTVYLPPGVDVTAADRVVVRGETYEVLGDAADWRTPAGARVGAVVQLQKVSG